MNGHGTIHKRTFQKNFSKVAFIVALDGSISVSL